MPCLISYSVKNALYDKNMFITNIYFKLNMDIVDAKGCKQMEKVLSYMQIIVSHLWLPLAYLNFKDCC